MTTSASNVLRQSSVIPAAVFMLIAAAVGGGLWGGEPVSELQDGALSTTGSPLAPAGPAFSIWSVIYLGLAAYTIWQALPAQRADQRQQAVGWWIAVSMVLNGLWLVTARFAMLWTTVLVIVLLLLVLARIIVLLERSRSGKRTDVLLVDGVTGLHFGWVAIATVANTSAWLARILPSGFADHAAVWGVVVLAVVAVIGIACGIVTARVAPAVAMAWGLSWLAVGRLAGEPIIVPIAIAAIVAAALILVTAVVAAVRLRAASSARTP
jgi:hypothetical protein